MQNIGDMTDADSQALQNTLGQIMREADLAISAGNSKIFSIYKLARDALDLLRFDATSRLVMHKLGVGANPVVMGMPLSSDVINYMQAGQKINAIKELRGSTGCGLLEAKNAIESVWDDYYSPF
jgi:hypothetical protein